MDIKFRSWHRKLKSMFSWEDIKSHLNTAFNGSDCILMQYTGIKDKNGFEIYDGDIVKMHWGMMLDMTNNNVDIWRNHAITFCRGDVGPCRGENVMYWRLGDCANLWDGKDVEVIGNIHENPELLAKGEYYESIS